MILENLESLQQWLIKTVKPLCDADPVALTKYVLALLKKEMPEEELRLTMKAQLEIFLQHGTVPFVNRLFEVIHSNKYDEVEADWGKELLSIDNNLDSDVRTDGITSQLAIANPGSSHNSETVNVQTNMAIENEGPGKAEVQVDPFESREFDKNDNQSSSSTNGSLSEYIKCDKKSGTLGLDNDKKRHWRDKRSRSCSSEYSPHRKRNRGQSLPKTANSWRSRTRWSPIKRRIRRDIKKRRISKSPTRFRSTGQHVNIRKSRGSISDRSRSQSGSPTRRKRTPSNDNKAKGGPSPPSPSESNSLLDNITNKCSVKSVIVKPATGSCSKNDKSDATSPARIRCVDFDEKGVCLRGELCPYDHGSDPVVLQDIGNNNSAGLPAPHNFNGQIQCEKPQPVNFINLIPPVRPPAISDEYFPDSPPALPPPMMPPFGWGIPGMPRRPMRHRHFGLEPFMNRGGMMHPSAPMLRQVRPPQLHGQRQLITVQVEGMQSMQHRGTPATFALTPENPFAGGTRMVCKALFGMRGRGRGTFDYSRLGTRLGKPNSWNCCLEVRKIPRELNNIESLINHFSRFGNVVSIQIGFDNDPEGALVIFGSHADANRAYRSTDAVLNNRFIKVFWFNKDKEVSSDPNNQEGHLSITYDGNVEMHTSGPDGENQHSSKESFVRANSPLQESTAVTDNESRVDELTTPNLIISSQQTVLQTEPPVAKTSRKANANAYDAKRKQEMMTLLNTQIQEQKSLIKKLEVDRNRMTQKQRDEVLRIIKNLQSSCETLKSNIEDINASSPGSDNASNKIHSGSLTERNSSIEEIRRKLLDAELALYMREKGDHSHHDTIDLEKEILHLRAEVVMFKHRK